ncbi:MAG: hypothetical protein HUJ26_00350 [Planctomycetaceae bacterium]|nr:hypothetical protein [Planctomycetaceae bacterium]
MPTYNKTVKRGNGKPITHYVGKNRKGVPEKFRLGYDPAAAQRRLDQIQAIWDHLEIWVSEAKANIEIKGKTKLRTYWTQPYLKAAKAIAKGEPPTLPKGEYEQPELYLKRLGLISEASGTKFEPANPDEYETAVYLVKKTADESRSTISAAANVPAATGQTLKNAIDGYEESVKRRHTQADGAIDAWGKARLDQMSTIRNYLSDKRFGGQNYLRLDLAELTFQRCDEIYGIFRGRPLTFLSKLRKRMADKSAKNYIKELGSFFDWLDGADGFDWIQPRRFHKISKTPDKLTAQEQYERRQKKQQSIIPSSTAVPMTWCRSRIVRNSSPTAVCPPQL